MKEFDAIKREEENQQRRKETGVDYSWLISTPKKSYEIPHIERLELESLCYKLKPTESTQVLSLFRDALLNEPKITDLPKIFKACINQVLEKRPKEESLVEWVTKRSVSLGSSSLRLRPTIRVSPGTMSAGGDPENSIQMTESPNHATAGKRITSISLPAYFGDGRSTHDVDSLPV